MLGTLCQTSFLHKTADKKRTRFQLQLNRERLRVAGHHLPGKAGQLLTHLIQTRVCLQLALQVQQTCGKFAARADTFRLDRCALRLDRCSGVLAGIAAYDRFHDIDHALQQAIDGTCRKSTHHRQCGFSERAQATLGKQILRQQLH
ncbi:hypothetical protein GGR72_000348 [Xanthomonas arboricola]|nr:hypothetical protein [Xanthomonas arboricola]